MDIWKGMTDLTGNKVALKSLAWEGVANDLVLTLKTRQTYKNDTQKNIEAVYTFPVAWNAVVSRFAVELNGKTLVAQAMEKKQAEGKYEDAIESGDMPVMLEYSDDGLCTANLGNLQPGETVVIEIETVKTLTWDNGRVRITVPTVIADRYSADGSQGDLLPHQQVSTNFLAEYPVDFHLELKGMLAYGEVDVPQHTARIEKTLTGVSIDLKRAYANKDIVVAITGLQAINSSVFATDPITEGRWAGFCTFTPIHKAMTVKPARMKILVDCSGSMNGPSIYLAKHALQSLAVNLTDDDVITLSCFGSGVEHKIRQPSNCTRHFMRQGYKPMIDGIDANMGGTDMLDALEAVINLSSKISDGYTADILMITDGEVWNADGMIDIVRQGNHRLFIIGVGVAPGENLLRRLAEATGGICEMVLPTEDMDETVSRMLSRMRLTQLTDITVEWKEQPVWHSPIPKNAYLGESITVAAIFDKTPVSPASLCCRLGDERIAIDAVSHFIKDDGQLAKAVVNEQVKYLDDEAGQTELAVRYSLIGEQTNLILVYERDDAEKAEGMPELHKVPQMAVEEYARYGGHAIKGLCFSFDDKAFIEPEGSVAKEMYSVDMDTYNIPAFLRNNTTSRSIDEGMPAPCAAVADFADADTAAESFIDALKDIIHSLNQVDWHDQEALLEIVEELPAAAIHILEDSGVDAYQDPATALVLFAAWLIGPASSIASRSLTQYVTAELDKLPESLIKASHDALDKAFPAIEKEGWDNWN